MMKTFFVRVRAYVLWDDYTWTIETVSVAVTQESEELPNTPSFYTTLVEEKLDSFEAVFPIGWSTSGSK